VMKNKLVLLPVVLLVLVGAGGAYWFKFKPSGPTKKPPPPHVEGSLFTLEPEFVVNLTDNHYGKVTVALLLILIGTSLLLGLFTQSGCTGALAMLSIFYLSAIPLGAAEAHAEGSYLIVNKNLIEVAAVTLLLVFRTGEIAGLDAWWIRSRVAVDQVTEVMP